MIKVGSKVRVIKGWGPPVGTIGIIDEIDDTGIPYHLKNIGWAKKVELLEEPMKYQDLKERIEALTGNSTLKEVDDIAQEINAPYDLDIPTMCVSVIVIHKHNKEYTPDYVEEKFLYYSQCEKLTALKNALLWLLNNSELAKEKDLVGKEIEADYNGTKIVAKVLRVVG